MSEPSITDLLQEYDRALDYTAALWADLTEDQVRWRPDEESSAIGWHLGHQAAVCHFMVRNLTAAEPSFDPDLDCLMDSATPERHRGELPDLGRLTRYRNDVADRLRSGMVRIDRGDVGAPTQLRIVAGVLLRAVINHEYQHGKWIGEVRVGAHDKPLPPAPDSSLLTEVDGYWVVA